MGYTHLVFGVELALQEIGKISIFDGRLDVVESRIETFRIENSRLGTDAGHYRVFFVQRKFDFHRTFRRHVPRIETAILIASEFNLLKPKCSIHSCKIALIFEQKLKKILWLFWRMFKLKKFNSRKPKLSKRRIFLYLTRTNFSSYFV